MLNKEMNEKNMKIEMQVEISGDDEKIIDEMYEEYCKLVDELQQRFITRNDKRRAFIDITSIQE